MRKKVSHVEMLTLNEEKRINASVRRKASKQQLQIKQLVEDGHTLHILRHFNRKNFNKVLD
jgi:hypothetical protein